MENIEELEKICQKITKLDPKMRSARLINSRGHLTAGGMKEGVFSLEAQKQDEVISKLKPNIIAHINPIFLGRAIFQYIKTIKVKGR